MLTNARKSLFVELWQDVKICLECLTAFVLKATAILKKRRDAQVNNKKPHS